MISEGDPLVLQATSSGTCTARVADKANVTVSINLGPVEGEIGLYTRATKGSFHSIAVYETVP